ncbi:hypothetical protein ArV1_028 [Arthrobacter phage vB_ArtM-ArV1]|uniref:Uncharacterized protein n=1 Tax=Arthrobacter phage vB_ArtM-ArV1 TaxID=1566993 RepID=A0A0A7HBT0_9CAUD|nr:hypothetical protein ArV1_028 [Arthrobacter phage vB_ArtM-ArV1]AIZ01716.1 hypothetical protein ArV1_028 [Arthrobacter phage vB_ArtM-ArV1]
MPNASEVAGQPKFPDVVVPLEGQDGNGFMIASRVRKALEKAGHREEAKEFYDDALSGDYMHLLDTVQKYVSI